MTERRGESPLRIWAIEPYGARSHVAFLEGLRDHSRHTVLLDTLPARKWKWRMRTASLHYARRIPSPAPDVWLVSDYANLAELLALTPAAQRPRGTMLYFHENQLTYPLQPHERRDFHYPLTHIHAGLVADRVVFNSEYHRREFLAAVPELLRLAPDVDLEWVTAALESRSSVLPLGVEVVPGTPRRSGGQTPILLWNHRWEYDKNPTALRDALVTLAADGCDFRVRLLGERFRAVPPELPDLQRRLGERLEVLEFAPDRDDYLDRVRGAHIVLSTADHEFFGLATLEALRCGLYPVLPADLAYPELLPDGLRDQRFLYPRSEGIVPTLRRAIEGVREDEWLPQRQELVRHTDRFAWPAVAPRYDALFEELDVAGLPGPTG